ncbi:hypothetical protein ACGF7U_27630 [Micromonospora sp. NPDC047670]|uniref:hypothetical protein n=1 Tax=Micromonospora sp. NPDC047670 TaxID=3364252 RepID=UPI0037119319
MTWNSRSPHGSSRNGMVMATPSPANRPSTPARSDTVKARISPDARWSRRPSGRRRTLDGDDLDDVAAALTEAGTRTFDLLEPALGDYAVR